MQLYLGMDVTSISRVERLLREYPDRFRALAFTRRERRYCDESPHPAQHYAARWAVKEAFIKSVPGTGSAPDLRSIELERDTPPELSLTGDGKEALRTVTKAGPRDVTTSVSLGHERSLDLAFAVVVILVH
jgi:holo-[acyl-carrier protein] synthase